MGKLEQKEWGDERSIGGGAGKKLIELGKLKIGFLLDNSELEEYIDN